MTWHEDDDFWRTFAPVMFGETRWERTAGEVDGLCELLDLDPPACVLDLCCGPGRHALELARRGFDVVGVDRTSEYLSEARERADAEDLEVEFVEDDMRTFRRPTEFDAIINMYTAFGYFDDPTDDRRVVENAFASLRPGGQFLIEVKGKECLAAAFQERHFHRLDDGTLLLEEHEIQRDWGWISNVWTKISPDGDVREFRLEHRLYSGVELKGLLAEVGFEVRAFGSLAGDAYDHTSKRLIVIGQKLDGP